MGKKKKIVILVLLIAVTAILFAFCASRRSISSEGIREAQTNVPFISGVNPYIPSYCVTDGGILYAYGGNIRYFDLKERQEYVLCDRANCSHLTDDCGSYYPDDNIEGLALYQGYVYRIQKNEDANRFELIRTDTSGNDRKVIAKLDIGNYGSNGWYLYTVENVHYSEGVLWAQARWEYTKEDGTQVSCEPCIGVSLSTGEIFEVTPREMREYDCNIVGILEGKLLLREDWEDETKDETSPEAHRETWMPYDMENDVLSTVDETMKIEMFGPEGEHTGWLTRYIIVGQYEGKFLMFEKEAEKKETEQDVALRLWDVEQNGVQDVCVLENSQMMQLNEDMLHDAVIDGRYLLYYHYPEQTGQKEVCRLDLSTGKSEVLFSVDRDWDYRIAAITSGGDAFLLKNYQDADVELYLISKEDYYAGRFDDMELLRDFRGIYL